MCVLYLVLRKARQRLADAEDGSRVSQFVLKALCERVRGAEQVKQAEQGLCADIEFEGPIQFPSVGGGQEHCSETCEWDANAYRDEDDNPPDNPPSCGDRVTFLINAGWSRPAACTEVATELPHDCGGCVPT